MLLHFVQFLLSSFQFFCVFFKFCYFYLFVHRGPGQVARMIISGCLLDLLLGLVGACSLKFHVQIFTNKSRNIKFLEFAVVSACSLEFHVQPFYDTRNIKFLEFGVQLQVPAVWMLRNIGKLKKVQTSPKIGPSRCARNTL